MLDVGQGDPPSGSASASVFALFPIESPKRDGNGTASHVCHTFDFNVKIFHRKRKLIRHEYVLVGDPRAFSLFSDLRLPSSSCMYE